MKEHQFAATKVKAIKPLHDTILVSDMTFDERVSEGGIILRNDDMKSVGIRPRWAKVYAIGPKVMDLSVGQWVLISHGRWTRGIKIQDSTGAHTIRKVDPNDLLLVSDEPVQDYTMSDKEV